MAECRDGHEWKMIRKWSGGIVAMCDVAGCDKTLSLMKVNAMLNAAEKLTAEDAEFASNRLDQTWDDDIGTIHALRAYAKARGE